MSDPAISFLMVVIAVILLGIASYHDIKTRMVSDWIWICMIGSGSVLHILQLVTKLNSPNETQEYIFSLGFNLIIALILVTILTLTALGGEADRIAFFAIVFVTPLQHSIFTVVNIEYAHLFSLLPKILGIFFNAYLLAIFVPISILFYNLIQKRRKRVRYNYQRSSRWTQIFLHFIGYPKTTNDIVKEIKEKPWHFDFLEEFIEGEWYIHFQMQLDTPEADLERKLKIAELLETDEKNFVWVQPSLPFISFIFFGYILEFLVGNLILSIMSFVF
ncbi:MAG: A24 family peptidase C-terminal domain-containing protein [Candidatus Kariarchaeaceae archaeon]